MSKKIEFLVPLESLPAEGGDFPAFEGSANRNKGGSRRALLAHCMRLLSESGIGFLVKDEGISPVSGNGGAMRLQHGTFGFPENAVGGAEPNLELSAASTVLDLEPILADAESVEFSGAEDPEDFLRGFLEHFNTRLGIAIRGFKGNPIPLLRWSENGQGEGISVQFCGVLLADGEFLEELREGEEGVNFDAELGLILEGAEIEGRGLREVAATLAVMGVVMTAAPSAEAGLFGGLFKSKDRAQAEHVVHAPRQAAPKIDTRLLVAAKDGARTEVIVDVGAQRAYVVVGGQVAIDTPISTARNGKHTPRGEFTMTQRVRTGKTSTIYGCPLPYWMRLDDSAIGMHVGDLPGYPASAGCVRLPHNVAPLIFDATSSGTTVRVVDSWSPNMVVAGL
ncbi:MAG: L,D-transpeptidase [Verrucomicrobiales bacterium]